MYSFLFQKFYDRKALSITLIVYFFQNNKYTLVGITDKIIKCQIQIVYPSKSLTTSIAWHLYTCTYIYL